MRDADDRRQMMLACGNERDRTQQDGFVIPRRLAKGAVQQVERIDPVAGETFAIGARHPRRRLRQPFARGIVACRRAPGATRRLDLGRSEKRRVGKEWDSTCRYLWSPY